MPNISFATLDEVPEGLREHAKQTDGRFVVNVVPEVRLAEFRENNIAISRERDSLKGVVGKLAPIVGEDVDGFVQNYGTLTTIAQQVKDGTLKGSDAIQAEVDNRVATMKTGFESQLQQKSAEAAQWQSAAAEADQRFKRSIVDRAVTEAVVSDASGANPGALSDILVRAYSVFQVGNDGRLVAKDGDAIIYGADGATPMTPLEWMGKLRQQAPYFFKNSSGGGANGGNGQNPAYGGMSKADFDRLPPERKLSIALQAKQGAGKR
jgi:hypothetical protein